jgi:predicted RNase H-like nuclease (RuvC/YqgF family)
VNERGNVEMSKETFMNREKDLLRLEAKVQVLEKALQEERTATDEYIAKMKELEDIINKEQREINELRITNLKNNLKWLTIGVGVGIIIGLVTD